ncbi:transglutaminase domain-containing protein [Flavobacterium sp.]|uniref:transglutaminase domain-containing protein n=1 Tax=Flavobacterium sp. TaxID=239 RepID=UPI002B4B03ED|nr:transglutaminase domain-containing protein [Flavobacterium sp.]HLP65619.1 transglutaminase domain-containing protein [Flavobacterium sp.]
MKLNCWFLIVFTFFSFANTTIFAQKYELGKVTKAELREKVNPNDTTAPATILFKKAKTTFRYYDEKGFVSITDFYIKLKIYKKEGFDWANFEIPYYVGYEAIDNESISIVSAFTYNLEGDEIVKEKVASEGKFKERINEYWESKSITFPNIKEGSIIELRYQLKSENLSELPDFQYQYKIPVNYAEYISEIPEFYLYKGIRSGFVDVELDQKLEDTSQPTTNTSTSNTSYLYYKQIKSVYKAEKIPALIEEKYVNNINNYYGKLTHELMTIRYPDEAPKQIAKNWEDVAKSIYLEKKFGDEIEKNKYYLYSLKAILSDADSYEKKLEIVFNYVKNTLNWNGKYGYLTKDGVEKAYENRVGNGAEINLILVSMLKMAGIDARPVLISTRKNGIALFPNRSQLNFVIARAQIGEKLYVMDATDKNSYINILPIRDLNWEGRAIDKSGESESIDLMPKQNSIKITNMMCTIDEGGNVTGKLKEQYTQYQALYFNDLYENTSNQNYSEKLEDIHRVIKVENCSVSKEKQENKEQLQVIVNYDFSSSDLVDTIGDKMFFSPLMFFTSNESPFKQEKREYPVDFIFPKEDKYLFNIEFPAAYVVESMPKAISIQSSGNLLGFKYITAVSGNKIQLSVTVSVNSSLISADYYQELKAVFNEIIKKENEKIVLKKI